MSLISRRCHRRGTSIDNFKGGFASWDYSTYGHFDDTILALGSSAFVSDKTDKDIAGKHTYLVQ